MFTTRALVRTFFSLLIAAALACCGPAFAKNIEAEFGEREIEYGKQAAAEIAKDHKLSDNAEDLKRLRDMGQKIAAVANKMEIKAVYGSSKVTPFEYQFNIIEDEDVNAFSVPGGFIYINRGLLNFVQSDQELAAVVAHEITHAAHHHMVYLLSKQASLNNQMAIALLATMISGARASDLGNVLLGVQLYNISKLSGYGMQAERDADYGAVMYMKESGYNPVGLLTFMERLARRPELVDYGIYRSHPLDADRVRAARKLITDLKIPINRRETTNAITALVKSETVDGAELPGVYIQDKLIYRPAPTGGKSSAQRAQEVADRINKALDDGVRIHELTVDPLVGGVVARDNALVTVTEADAKLTGKTISEVAKDIWMAVRNVILKQMVETVH